MTQAGVTLEVYEGSGKRRKDWTLETDINGKISLEDFFRLTKTTIISVARGALSEEQAKGFDKSPRVRVDNKFDLPEDAVSPLGKIEYFPRVASLEVVLFAYRAILDRSPVDSGLYRSSHYVFLNGRFIASNEATLVKWVKTSPPLTAQDKIRIVNLTPYARKLELSGISKSAKTGGSSKKARLGIRKKNGRPIQVKIPNGAYQLAERAIRNRFKASARTISFSYIAGNEAGVGSVVPIRPKFRTTFKRGRSGQVGRPYVYPSIVIKFSDQGILQ